MTQNRRDILFLMIGFAVMGGLFFLFQEQAQAAVNLMGSYSGTPLAVAVAVLVFLVGSIFFVPQWALIAAAIAAFGLVEGTGIAWFATMVSTTVHIFAARALEKRLHDRLDHERLNRLKSLFKRNSIESGFIVRLVPTGPAILVNAAAGLFGVSRGGFLLGTAVGIIPKILLTGIVASELISSARAQQVSLGLAIFGVIILAVFVISRWRRGRSTETGIK